MKHHAFLWPAAKADHIITAAVPAWHLTGLSLPCEYGAGVSRVWLQEVAGCYMHCVRYKALQ